MPKQTFFNLSDEKRARIADIATDEFAARAFGEASISRIVARAGIAKGSFYQYFDDKFDLYRWLFYEVIGEQKRQFFVKYPPPPELDIFGQIGHMLLIGLRFGMANPRLSRLASWAWNAGANGELGFLRKDQARISHHTLRILLQQGQASGHVRTDIDLDMAADFLGTVLQHALDTSLRRLYGVDLMELCSNPDQVASFTPEAQAALVGEMVKLLRLGLGTGAPGGAGEFKLDMKAVLEEALGRSP